MLNFLSQIPLSQLGFVSSAFLIVKNLKNAFFNMLNVNYGRDERRPGLINPQDLNANALTDEEQREADFNELLLNTCTAGLCIVHAYGIATGSNSIADNVLSTCIAAKAGWDVGVQACDHLNASFKPK